jgi:hypothetical protein
MVGVYALMISRPVSFDKGFDWLQLLSWHQLRE